MEDDISLPADTLAILQQFLVEKAEKEQRELVKTGKEAEFEENWQLSQFWYCLSTKQALGSVVSQLLDKNEVLEKSPPLFSIALLSCPSLYSTIKEIHENVKIFEFDKRFSAYGADFIFYDFNEAYSENYLQDLWQNFDLIIADPPFLSEECITKISQIIKNLLKAEGKIIFCSGEVVEPWLIQNLPVQKCNFQPEHERNLGNEFVSYANFKLDDFIKRNK